MPNRLAGATSPYLLQHSSNPVDWYPWGEEAFARARRLDRPVLLSIGYAACHWCHVMAHESFEDAEVARLMNEAFVCVKVDREERPDVDAVYMSAVQAMTGGGGWPLTVVATPEGAPFFGGTYFPPRDRWGQPAFRRVLEGLSAAWRERRGEVEEAARRVGDGLQGLQAPVSATVEPAGRAPERAAAAALERLRGDFDDANGGFGGAPKFPPHGVLRFLLARSEAEALAMATATLDAMADGGLHDQLGGGFARYSVDAGWQVPHFEKMLYDNAQLLQAYAEGYWRSGRERYRQVADGIVAWLDREMRGADGGLVSSLDADSDGAEGRFYVWTGEEVDAAAGPEAELLKRIYGVRAPGPVDGSNVLRRAETVEAAGSALGLEPGTARERFERGRVALLAARAQRRRPAVDDKVLTSWNGLALAGLADAARLLGSEPASSMARDTVAFLRRRLREGDRLLHAYRSGAARVEGFLEDYAYLGLGLLALHRWTLERPLLTWALELAATVRRDFQAPDGGFFSTSRLAERLLVRPRALMDASVPSDNAAAAELLARLARLTGDDGLREAAERALRPLAAAMERHPQAFASALGAWEVLKEPPREVVLVGDPDAADTRALAAVWRRRAQPSVAAVLVSGPQDPLAGRWPLLRGRRLVDGRATAYVCEAGVCRLPATTVAGFEEALDAAGIAPLEALRPPHRDGDVTPGSAGP